MLCTICFKPPVVKSAVARPLGADTVYEMKSDGDLEETRFGMSG